MPIPHQAQYGTMYYPPGLRASNESGRQLPDVLSNEASGEETSRFQNPRLQILEHESPLCTNRAELIERIKNGESPTWVPNERLQQEYLKENGIPAVHSVAEEITQSQPATAVEDTAITASEIERPPSALHAGDFKARFPPETAARIGEDIVRPTERANSFVSDWLSSSRPAGFDEIAPWADEKSRRQSAYHDHVSQRSFSSSNYILKQPTTPLVYQSTRSPSPDKALRRHTLPQSHPEPARLPSPLGSPRPRQIYPLSPSNQGRRSATFTWSLQHPPSPPTPGFLRSRRASYSSESSTRHRASMVGSYEESILQGRMSTAPSKPFDFHAHIGALGQGRRPKMPPQINVPFQAVFYEWSRASQQHISDKEPSPYVGEIDLHRRDIVSELDSMNQRGPIVSDGRHTGKRRAQRDIPVESATKDSPPSQKRDSDRFSVPLGSYRIPIRGQIQVVIKNPYKTALKLFLVPYDLSGMCPGQKTFVRQRYYSAGPVIERPVVADPMTPLPANHSQKPTLRYLIHLKMCCPRQGYYCLYSDIRVVFANRVPDDKEYLTKDLQEPNPKYSPWKPSDLSCPSTPSLKQDGARAFRRRSSGFNYKDGESIASNYHAQLDFPSRYAGADIPPVPPIPFNLPPSLRPCGGTYGAESTEHDDGRYDGLDGSDKSSIQRDQSMDVAKASSSRSSQGETDKYAKLKIGEAGYGGNWSGAGNQGVAEGLLARRLKCGDDP